MSGHDAHQARVYAGGEDAYPIPRRTLEFAHALNQSWGLAAPDTLSADDLFGRSYAGDPYAALAAEVGRPDLAGEQPQFQPYPDVSEIARQMGLR